MNWKKVKLRDICKPKQWKTISTSELKQDGYPVYGANGKIGFYHEYTHENETILITCRGATCGTVNICEPKSYVNGNAMALDNLKEECHLKFLFYFFQKRGFNDVISGSAQPQITGQGLAKVEIPLPDLATQKHIAEVLDKADAIRQQNRALLAQYDELLQSTFIELFGDPVKNPKGWEMKTINMLVKKNKNSIKRGPFGGALKKEIFKEGGYLVYEQYHALNNDFSFKRYFIDEKKFEELKSFEIFPEDIIISCSGVNLGRLAVIPENAQRGIINQALLKVTLNQSIINNTMFVYIFSNENFKGKYFGDNRGSGVPNFPPMEDFKKFKFIVPPISLQQHFAKIVEQIEAQKEHAKAALGEGEALFEGLLAKYFG